MKYRFPLGDINIEQTLVKREVSAPLFNDGIYSLNQNEFSMDVQGVAWFYASGGNFISLVVYPGAERSSVELYLNGSVYGAILHQRQIMPLHGSCFLYNAMGVMICGDTGAGKSSLTASFCLDGAAFLTDDVSPLFINEGLPYVWAVSDRIKLWADTLKQLGRDEVGLQSIEPEAGKFYYPMDGATGNMFRLNRIYILEISEADGVEFEELAGSSKFTAVRNEIYRPEYLQGMPENEPVYFKTLVDICNKVNVFRVRRPALIEVQELMRQVKKHGVTVI